MTHLTDGDSNLPDDWDCCWRRCARGHRYHASEGSCPECDILDEREAEADETRGEDDPCDPE